MTATISNSKSCFVFTYSFICYNQRVVVLDVLFPLALEWHRAIIFVFYHLSSVYVKWINWYGMSHGKPIWIHFNFALFFSGFSLMWNIAWDRNEDQNGNRNSLENSLCSFQIDLFWKFRLFSFSSYLSIRSECDIFYSNTK